MNEQLIFSPKDVPASSGASAKRSRKIGFYWLLTPIIVFFATLVLFAFVNVLFSGSFLLVPLNLLFSIMGVVSLLIVPVGIIVGIVYLLKKD